MKFTDRLNGWNRLGIVISFLWILAVIFIVIIQFHDGPGSTVKLVIEELEAAAHTSPAARLSADHILDGVAQKQPASQIRETVKSLPLDSEPWEGSSTEDPAKAKQIIDPFDPQSSLSSSFDDLIPSQKSTYRIKVADSLALAFYPILFCWIFAYLTIWSIRWVVNGFKKNDI